MHTCFLMLAHALDLGIALTSRVGCQLLLFEEMRAFRGCVLHYGCEVEYDVSACCTSSFKVVLRIICAVLNMLLCVAFTFCVVCELLKIMLRINSKLLKIMFLIISKLLKIMLRIISKL